MSNPPRTRPGQPDVPVFALERLDGGIRLRVGASAVLGALLLAGLGGWATQTKLSGAVVTQGQLAVSDQVKVIQHNDGGVVGDILVQNGDHVKKGAVLVRLDETQIRVERSIILGELDQLRASKARLEAERDGAGDLALPSGLPPAIAAGERKLFTENREMLANQRAQLVAQQGQLENQIDGLRQQLSATRDERDILAVEITAAEDLFSKGLGRSTDLRGLKRQMVRLDGNLGDIQSRIASAEGERGELGIKLLSLDQNRRTELQKDIVGTDSKIAELAERDISVRHRLERTEIRAPLDGTVYDLQVHTIGGVIAAGAPLMSLVPEGARLQVEVHVAPADIDRVYPDQPVRLRLTAFNSRTTPELHGKLDVVSAAASVDKTNGSSYYLATVHIDEAEEAALNRKLMPGMPAEVFIQTESRTALSYLVKPFTDQALRAFREE